MQHISWNVFSATGDVDAYLLYRDFQRVDMDQSEDVMIYPYENSEGHEGYLD